MAPTCFVLAVVFAIVCKVVAFITLLQAGHWDRHLLLIFTGSTGAAGSRASAYSTGSVGPNGLIGSTGSTGLQVKLDYLVL